MNGLCVHSRRATNVLSHESDIAKVGVASSILVARSKYFKGLHLIGRSTLPSVGSNLGYLITGLRVKRGQHMTP